MYGFFLFMFRASERVFCDASECGLSIFVARLENLCLISASVDSFNWWAAEVAKGKWK